MSRAILFNILAPWCNKEDHVNQLVTHITKHLIMFACT